MDFDIWYYGQQTDIGYSKMKKAFEAGQKSKQKKIDAALQYLDGCHRKIEIDKKHIQELLK